MTNNFDNVLKLVLQSEGGFVNDPRDPGGMTNLGVTQRVWEAFVGRPVSEVEMMALSPAPHSVRVPASASFSSPRQASRLWPGRA